MLEDVKGMEFEVGDKVVIKKEVREYMKKNYKKSPRVYMGDPYFTDDMWLAIEGMEYLTIKRKGYVFLKTEEGKGSYDARWLEYYRDKLEGAEDF